VTAAVGGARPASVPARATTRTVEVVRDARGQVTSQVRRTTLPSGLRILTEEMAGARSASVGVFVGVGSRHENAASHGASHFLEHLLFKGTRERSALDISIALDEVGGEFNAFTAKEYTCYHARVLGDDLPRAIDVLGDMITDSVVAADDVDAERDVILDEIAMHEDDPDDVVHNLFAEVAWGSETPLGRPIAGTADSIGEMTRERIRRFYRRHYRPENMVVAVAGAVDHSAVVRAIRAAFARRDFLDSRALPAYPVRTAGSRRLGGGAARLSRPLEQANVVVGREGVARDDDRRFALGVLNTALGGGTSSRLFQEVRERRGLAYSVFSFSSQYSDSGVVGVSVGCLPDRLDAVLDTVRAELDRVAADGISADELRRGRAQLVGGLVLGLEDSASRMMRLGRSELSDGEVLGIDEVAARIEAVTRADVQQVAAEIFDRPELLAVVGPGPR
jgi:predicted Zn-dependent peptidase